MFTKQMVGLVAVGLSVFAVACSGPVADDASDSATGAATVSSCKDTSATPCTPEVGSPLRKEISDLLRFSIKDDFAKNGVSPADADMKFVFKTMLIQHSHIYVAATIMRGDGTTPFDMTGTSFEGKSNTVQSLMEVESGSEFSHKVGIGLDPKDFACDFVDARFDGQAPGIYQGDMAKDCQANKAKEQIDTDCFVRYTHAAGECNKTSGNDDAAFDVCLAPVKESLKSCCSAGGSSECANP